MRRKRCCNFPPMFEDDGKLKLLDDGSLLGKKQVGWSLASLAPARPRPDCSRPGLPAAACLPENAQRGFTQDMCCPNSRTTVSTCARFDYARGHLLFMYNGVKLYLSLSLSLSLYGCLSVLCCCELPLHCLTARHRALCAVELCC